MARTKGTFSLSANIEPRAAAPLDARTVVPTLADLTASGAFPYPYVGMIVSVQSEGKAYMLTALDTTVSSNWTEVGTGASGSQTLAELDDVDVNLIEWYAKTWTGLTSFIGDCIWSDGENIYYSSSSNQYVLDKSTSTWSTKTWSGLTSFDGNYIWSDGENIYYSDGSNQYELNKSTSIWYNKTWLGLTNFDGSCIWSDGENIYYSLFSTQYELDKSTSTWSTKTWSGLTNFDAEFIWSDGENIYCSNGSNQYELDKSTSTWSTKTWSGLTNFYGSNIWSDGENIYYSAGLDQYVLDKSTSTWTIKEWIGLTNLLGAYIWTDGNNIYYSLLNNQYVLNRPEEALIYDWNSQKWINKEIDIPKIFTGTQAEWDLLTAEEKKAYDYTAFTDDNPTNYTDIYSTSEVKTNKVWIDGKPIYRKVFTGTLNATEGQQKIELTDTGNIYKVIKVCGNQAWGDANTSNIKGYVTIPYILNSSSTTITHVTGVYTYLNNIMYCVFKNGQLVSRPYEVVVEYTKTTD